MTLLELRQAIVETLRQRLGVGVEVLTHGGAIDAAEVQRWGAKTPCVAVGLLGIPKLELDGGSWNGDLRWTAFFVASDDARERRDAAAVRLLEAGLAVIRPEERWGDPSGGAPHDLSAANLYSPALDRLNVALWAVAWRQQHQLDALDLETLSDFITYDAVIDVGGDATPKPEDTVTLPSGG